MGHSPGDVTSLLNRLARGDDQAGVQLVPLIYEELRRLAYRCCRRERSDHTLQPTALVHEAYLKLAGQKRANWQSRTQFFAVASNSMRRILVDYARTQARTKRGGGQQRLSLDDVPLFSANRSDEVLAVNQSLMRLEQLDCRQARIVELRYFGGLTFEEVAEAMSISSRTVKREWSIAKAWLYGELKECSENNPATVGEGKDAI